MTRLEAHYPRSRSAALLVLAALCLLAGRSAQPVAATTEPVAGSLTDPVSRAHQTLLDFGQRSHWLQPWRAYLETVPAERLVNALGINFNPAPRDADATAKKLVAAGFTRARLEISWCRVSYDEPARLTGLPWMRTMLGVLRENDLRPLILLNGHHGCPAPLRHLKVRLLEPARAGDTQLTLDPASVGQVVPGRTGLDSTTEYKAAAFLFTRVTGNTITLSRPLDRNLAAGAYDASTLRYAPFGRPGDPAFEETLEGWLRYVGLVTSEVKAFLRNQDFDVEVWNELSFGSDFLNANTYYSSSPATAGAVTAAERAILDRTVAFLRDPRNGVSKIGIGNGFANLRPWDAGSNAPAGLTAIDKHPYPPRRSFPQQATFTKIRPLNAHGQPEGTQDSAGRWHDSFIPSYTAFFPEYFLAGIQTETAIRDLSPITTEIYGTPHGRNTHPPGSPPPELWITEAGMDPAKTPAPLLPRLQAKAALRWASAWLNKGATALYYYAVSSPGWGIVDLGAPGGGLTLRALARMTKVFKTDLAPITRRRSLSLLEISDTHDRMQFEGDGTPAHPPLYDRDVVGFFPFQSSNGRVVVASYVMSRNLLRSYRPDTPASNPLRYDMPPERFRLTIGGVAGIGRNVSLIDPLTDSSGGVRVISRTRNRLVVDVELTDSPRLLVLGGDARKPRR